MIIKSYIRLWCGRITYIHEFVGQDLYYTLIFYIVFLLEDNL